MSADDARSVLVATAVAAVALSLLAILLLGRYRGTPFEEDFLFTTIDQPPTSSPIAGYVVGKAGHVFGDFVVTYENVVRHPFNPFVSPVAYGTPYAPPFLVFLKGLFAIGSYKFQLWLFMFVSVVFMAMPAVWASRHLSWSNRVVVVSLFGLIPFPILIALDRGNPQSYVVPALFFAALWIERQQWSRSVVMIIVGTCIKLYPIVLVVPLLIKRQFKMAAAACLGSALLILLALTVFDGSLGHGVRGLLDITSHHSGRQSAADFYNFEFYNWSLAGALARFGELTHVSRLVTFIADYSRVPGLLLFLGSAVALAFSWRLLPSWARAVMYLAPTQLCVPISYPYAMTWVLIPIAFAIRPPGEIDGIGSTLAMPRWLQTSILVALALAVSIKPTWSGVSVILDPSTASWKNFAQVLDPFLLTAAVSAIGAWGLLARFRYGSENSGSAPNDVQGETATAS